MISKGGGGGAEQAKARRVLGCDQKKGYLVIWKIKDPGYGCRNNIK